MALGLSDNAELASGTPVLAEVSLPPVEYPEETQAFLDDLDYRFPVSACCK